MVEATTPASQVGGVEGGRGAWTATSGTLTLDEETPVYAAPDKDSGAVSTLPAGDVDWDKYEILPDGNWYSFVKEWSTILYFIFRCRTLINDLKRKHDNSYKVIMFFMFHSHFF